jgi:hypothetical protein
MLNSLNGKNLAFCGGTSAGASGFGHFAVPDWGERDFNGARIKSRNWEYQT